MAKSQVSGSTGPQRLISFRHGQHRMTVPCPPPLKTREDVISATNLASSKFFKLPLEIIREILVYTFVLDQHFDDDDRKSSAINAAPAQNFPPLFMILFGYLQYHDRDNIFNTRSPGRDMRHIARDYALSKILTKSFIENAAELHNELQNVSRGTGLAKLDTTLVQHPDRILQLFLQLYALATKGHLDTEYRTRSLNIVKHRCNKNTFLAVAATCRYLYVIVQPMIYEMVELELDSTMGRDLRVGESALNNKKVPRSNLKTENSWRAPIGDILPRSILNPDTASHVRAISFSNKSLPLRNERIFAESSTFIRASVSSIRAVQMAQPISAWSPCSRMRSILELFPNLQVLKIQQDHGWQKFLDILKVSKSEPFMLPAALQNLTEISLTWTPAEGSPWTSRRLIDPEALLPLFLLPKIQSLYLSIALVGISSTAQDGTHKGFEPHVGKSTLKKLILEDLIIEAPFLKALLRLPSALECFSYTRKDGRLGNLIHGPVDALFIQRETLRTVDLKILPSIRDLSSTYPDETIWTQFPVLQHLAVPLEPLIISPGHLPTRFVRDDDCLNRAFPKGIKSLRFYLLEEWHSPLNRSRCWSWRKIVESIRRNVYPELETVWVGIWDAQCLTCDKNNRPIEEPGWSNEHVKIDVKHFISMPNRPRNGFAVPLPTKSLSIAAFIFLQKFLPDWLRFSALGVTLGAFVAWLMVNWR